MLSLFRSCVIVAPQSNRLIWSPLTLDGFGVLVQSCCPRSQTIIKLKSLVRTICRPSHWYSALRTLRVSILFSLVVSPVIRGVYGIYL